MLPERAAASCSPLTLTHIHSVLKSALEQAVREEKIPSNVTRNVRAGTPQPQCFGSLTVDEPRRLLTTPQGHRLHALLELALHAALCKDKPLNLRWEDLGKTAQPPKGAPVPTSAVPELRSAPCTYRMLTSYCSDQEPSRATDRLHEFNLSNPNGPPMKPTGHSKAKVRKVYQTSWQLRQEGSEQRIACSDAANITTKALPWR
ncbi:MULTISPECIES: hypothetical protein [Streptomyces]|uniref:Uncharacterized protein n=1 Tax=Streptomyces thermoalcalitolerans TaxID=65605 RepID=A0ABP3YVL7_9ACTN|nr:hypothetical protein [Streptomyces sp. LB8]MDN5384875.1 hypothetical protein [Streptomyces sp. LB8]